MSSFNIKIKDQKGKEKILRVNSSDTIGQAKANSGLSQYNWKYNGEKLKDDKTIEFYGIEEDDVILLSTPSPGGKV